ncbi:MAG: phenylalanine--tRNA ligase subunit beta [Verrucomicrobiae bacterium]|nr:phenylalanine--tRNA ligase subunit beta [Verrucomicrobiae bacterium]
MKVTFNWLKQYVEFGWSPEELAERLTMLGMEVESMQKLPGEFDGVVVAQVLTKEKHPNADKLTVCRVFDGKTERQIVCGATNFNTGDKVPLILPGYALPPRPGQTEPVTIKASKIRGIESHGMMCSGLELGLSEDGSGLMILPPDAPVGQPLAEFLGRTPPDVVYDLEITPNRPDLNSVVGIAREIAALTGNKLRMPEVNVVETTVPVETLVSVQIEAPELCPRYTARVIQGVKVGPSPAWLRTLLEKVGIRSINNVVDATNFVMMELGQPLHAFDYNLIARDRTGKPAIVVRRARPGEQFVTLDGQQHTLTDQMLLIADPEKPVALAGIMGGQNSEINERTVDVLIESAYFNPSNIRRTSKALGLRTDASYRFERGADIEISSWASLRCAQLILDTAGGQLAKGVVDVYPLKSERVQITLRHKKTNELLGITIPAEEQVRLLLALGLTEVSTSPAAGTRESTTFAVPSWRIDLKREVDLIEEIERLYGVEKVPPTPPRGAIGSNPFDAVYDQIVEAKRILAGLGLDEAQGQTLVSSAACSLWRSELVELANPLSSEMNALRPSLIPGLLDILRHNVAHKNRDIALFEVGRVFSRTPDAAISAAGDNSATARAARMPFREQWRVAIALTGCRNPVFWSGEDREAKFDTYDLKGLVEEFLERFGLRGITYTRRAEPTELFIESATALLGGKLALGELGQLHPLLARRYDLRDPVLIAELNMELLLAHRDKTKTFKPLPVFPAIRRDVAMIVREEITHDAVLAAIKRAKPPHLEHVELFDVFRGGTVPPGHKSVAYAFTYRAPDRTLTDAEVNSLHQQLVTALKLHLGATIRDTQ